ncbi:MAG: hypothetical protein AABZ47_17720 [Planctomycetota bacterium]
MRGRLIGSLAIVAVVVSPLVALAVDRADISEKGSLLIFSKVELKWQEADPENGDGGEGSTAGVGNPFELVQDTFLTIANDYPESVHIQLYFVQGDPPLFPQFAGDPPALVERFHQGWNWFDCQVELTANQPTHLSLESGLPLGCQPFTALDPGNPPGRPDREVLGGRILRGYVLAWAVDPLGNEISWNHLQGSALIAGYGRATAWEYEAHSFRVLSAGLGEPTDDMPGQLLLNGREYATCFDKLLFQFHTTGSQVFSRPDRSVFVNTDLTLHPVTADLRQDFFPLLTTIAKFDLWNMNEVRFSGTSKRISCWDEALLSRYGSDTVNQFSRSALQTDEARARIDGVISTNCDTKALSVPLLGVTSKQVVFVSPQIPVGFAEAGRTLVGTGEEDAGILYDIISGPDELRVEGPSFESPQGPPMRPGSQPQRRESTHRGGK